MIVGIDEVGRGCWAGPLVAAAVGIVEPIAGLYDSKLLSARRRQILADEIQRSCIYGIGWVWPAEIDSMGLTEAVRVAMLQALNQITRVYEKVIIDGNYNYFPEKTNTVSLIKADKLIPEVSAASIIAKVTRDAYMAEQATIYPEYGFDKHVGYGTKQHSKALSQYGICAIHRRSYKPIRLLLV